MTLKEATKPKEQLTDTELLLGEIRERNFFYKTLVEIQHIAESTQIKDNEKTKRIINKCNKALEGVI